MKSMQIKNNEELYHYLVWLSDELKRRDKSDMAGEVTLASHFACGSPSEFLHETLKALTSVRAECSDVLVASQLEDLESVVEQIKSAFQRIGGA